MNRKKIRWGELVWEVLFMMAMLMLIIGALTALMAITVEAVM